MIVSENTSPSPQDNSESRIITVEANQFPRALDLLEEAFPDVNRGFFHAIALYDPFYKPAFSLAVERANRYLSFLQIFDRTINLHGQRVRIGGIGSVGTRPKEQGKGYSTQLMRHSIEVMEGQGMESSILFTKIHSFYERLGWTTVPQTEAEIPLSSIRHLRPSFHHYRRILEKDCQKIQEIYTNYASKIPGLVIRTPEYWDARAQWVDHIPIVVLDQDQLIGYFYMARYNLKEPVLTISELGMDNNEPRTMELMLGAMARKAQDFSCSAIRGFFRQIPALNDYLQTTQLTMRDKPHNYLMWRDLSGGSHLESVLELARQNQFLYWQTDAF